MLIKKFFIAFLIFFSLTVCAKDLWIVEDIQFKGLKNFSQNEALKNISFRIGSHISTYDVKNSIHSLFKTGKFDDIEAIYSGKSIIFNIKEKPILSNIIIKGNKILNNSILNEYLKKLNIEKGQSFNSILVDTFTNTIKSFYHSLGNYHVKVKTLKFLSEYNNIDLKILINEGQSKKINSIKILGNKNFSTKQIMSLFKSKDHHTWWNFLEKCIYSPKELTLDLERLTNFYLNHGYYYFSVDTKKIEFTNKSYLDIIINIFEGEKYQIEKFFVNGDLLKYKKFVTDFIQIKDYEVYNREKINLIVKNIARFLSERGYINAKIAVEPIVNHKNHTIILNFNIDINQRYFVKKIQFIGNELTQDKVLRREMKQTEGEYFNIKLVELGKKLLEKTKYFSNVEIIKNIDFYNSNQVNIIYKVKEQPTGSINFGLGYGIDSGISFNTSLSQENILGSGNSLKASIIKNDSQKYADLSMSLPYFIANNINLNTRLFYNDLKYNLNNASNLAKNTYGFESNLGFLINNFNEVNLGFGYSHNGINNIEKKVDHNFSKKEILEGFFLNNSLVDDFTINYSWMYNNLEYFYFPVSGNQTYISGKNTIPGSDNSFYKIVLDGEQYVPLDEEKKFIFLGHVHMGIGNSFNEENFPFYENFYTSSINNIRGFRFNTIGPKKVYNNSDSKKCIGYKHDNVCESIDSIGGNATVTANLELIVPIPLIEEKYSQLFRSSIFLDAGNIWDTQSKDIQNIHSLKLFQKNILNNIYSSFGISLQWFSPIGPLVFSYALPIQKNKNHKLEAFQFNFGKTW